MEEVDLVRRRIFMVSLLLYCLYYSFVPMRSFLAFEVLPSMPGFFLQKQFLLILRFTALLWLLC